jgi:hypothetical protein
VSATAIPGAIRQSSHAARSCAITPAIAASIRRGDAFESFPSSTPLGRLPRYDVADVPCEPRVAVMGKTAGQHRGGEAADRDTHPAALVGRELEHDLGVGVGPAGEHGVPAERVAGELADVEALHRRLDGRVDLRSVHDPLSRCAVGPLPEPDDPQVRALLDRGRDQRRRAAPV